MIILAQGTNVITTSSFHSITCGRNRPLTWHSLIMIDSMTTSGQRVMKRMRMTKAVRPICLQLALAATGVRGVFAVASGAGRGQRGVVRPPVEEDRVRLATGRGAASPVSGTEQSTCRCCCRPLMAGWGTGCGRERSGRSTCSEGRLRWTDRRLIPDLCSAGEKRREIHDG